MNKIEGLILLENAISDEYARCILEQLPHKFVEDIGQTSSRQYKNEMSPGSSLQMHFFSPLPDFISMISEDVIPDAWKGKVWHGLECNSSIIQRYKPGEGIRWHTDLPVFGDGVAILSLLSSVCMKFRLVEDHNVMFSVKLDPRSLLLCAGPARYSWEHHIESVEVDSHAGETFHREDRISITIRRVKIESACEA